jgi:hypothetical protein
MRLLALRSSWLPLRRTWRGPRRLQKMKKSMTKVCSSSHLPCLLPFVTLPSVVTTVEEIIDKRITKADRQLQYRSAFALCSLMCFCTHRGPVSVVCGLAVKWVGQEHPTWEPASALADLPEFVAAFEAKRRLGVVAAASSAAIAGSAGAAGEAKTAPAGGFATAGAGAGAASLPRREDGRVDWSKASVEEILAADRAAALASFDD